MSDRDGATPTGTEPVAGPAVRPTVSPRLVRLIASLLGFAGLMGIIAASIVGNTGLAITSGLLSAVSIGYLILLTAVVGREAFTGRAASPPVDERLARDLEARVSRLVAAGADESEVRQLISRAIELGRAER